MNSPFRHGYPLAHGFWELTATLRKLLSQGAWLLVLPCVLAHQSGTLLWWSCPSSHCLFIAVSLLPKCYLEEIKCWTCCFEALRFSGNKRLLAAASCLICPASNQGLRHRLYQRWCQRPSLTAQEKIEIETPLFWILLEGCHLSRWHPQKYQAWTHATSNSAATAFSSWCQPESWCTGFPSCSASAVWK